MGLADNISSVVGNKSPDVNDVNYHATNYDYGKAQAGAAQGMQAGQTGLANAASLYASAAAGQQPSVAQQQMVQGQQNAQMQAAQMAASARGGAGAGIMAQRQAADQAAMGMQAQNAQSGILRAQEMEQARAGMASVGAQQQGLGQQYGLGRQAQDIAEREAELRAQQGTQQVQSANDLAAMKQNGGIMGSMVGLAAGAAGAMCCAPSTLIDTPDGERRIDTMRVGDPVWSTDHNGHLVASVVARVGRTAHPRGTHHVLRLRLASGRTLEVSEGHPDEKGVPLSAVAAGDDLGGSFVRSVETVPFEGSTHDIRPATASGCYWAHGALIGSTLAAEAPRATWGAVAAEAG